jgi:hypothetical protein
MVTVLVHFKQWVDSNHALLDGVWVDHSKVIEVEKLTDLNDMFRHITKIEILEQTSNCSCIDRDTLTPEAGKIFEDIDEEFCDYYRNKNKHNL